MRAIWFLYIVFFAFSAAAIATLLSATNISDVPFASARIAAAALLATTAGWILSNAVNLQVKVRETSFRYLQDTISDLETTSLAAKLIIRWHVLNIEPSKDNPEEIRKFFYATYPQDELFHLIRKLANFYEHMALAVQRDTVDERMMRIYFASSLSWFFARLEPFLPLYRNMSGDPAHPNGGLKLPGAFCETEWLSKRWQGYDEIEAHPWTKPFFGFVIVRWLRLRWWWQNRVRITPKREGSPTQSILERE